MLVIDADRATQANTIASENLTGEIDGKAISNAEIGRDHNAVRIGRKNTDRAVDVEGSIVRNATADSAESTDSDALLPHGENLPLAGQGDGAATNIENSRRSMRLLGDDAIAVEINNYVVIDEEILGRDNVIKKSDFRAALRESFL